MYTKRAESIADSFLGWQFKLPYIRYECIEKQKTQLVKMILDGATHKPKKDHPWRRKAKRKDA